eukprot:gene5664-11433_t
MRTPSKRGHHKAMKKTDIELIEQDWAPLKSSQSAWPLFEDETIGNTPISPLNDSGDWDNERHILENYITDSYIREISTSFQREKRLPKSDIMKILKSIDQQFSTLPTLINITIPSNGHVTVCGDVHGQFYDFMNIFHLGGLPSLTNEYIFNGDLVDRSVYSLEILIFLFAIKLFSPDSVHIHRENHEVEDMTDRCVHGGLGEKLLSLDEIASIDIFTAMGVKGIKENQDVISLLWSDPREKEGFGYSGRCGGSIFGPDVTAESLKTNNLDLLIRSHQVAREGYNIQHNGKFVTVFSAPNYCDSGTNFGAFIKFGEDLVPEYVKFKAVPNPRNERRKNSYWRDDEEDDEMY